MPIKFWKGQWDGVAIAASVLLVFSVVFGGASQSHALRLALVELASLPLLVLASGRLIKTGTWRGHRLSLGILGAIVAIPIIQLIPLPPVIWTSLPGRDEMALALGLVGVAPNWAPLSVTPDRTWGSALALAPPAAFFLAVLGLTHIQQKRMVYICIGVAIASILLGAAQLASGSTSLYFWDVEAGSIRGFFANRNHLASFLLIVLTFVIVFGAATLRRRDRRTTALWIGALIAGVVVVALAAIRSRAGITLFAPVVVVSLLAAWIAAGRGRPGPGLLVMIGSVGVALTAVAILALPPILARFDSGGPAELRFENWPLIAETAQNYLPLGSGMGSFDAVYRSVEPLEKLDATFFNQAHNDYLETWLEAGWLGIGVILAFLNWYARRCWTAWKAPASREGDLQRAASIGIGVLILHSAVDYPLRTVTLAVFFALCCGLLELSQRPGQLAERGRMRVDPA